MALLSSRHRLALGLLFPVFAALGGCADDGPTSSANEGRQPASPAVQTPTAPATPTDQNGTAQRAIAEADIIQLQSGKLFAISKAGTLTVIDVSQPGRLVLLGQAFLPGEPFEMYVNGDRLTLMMNNSNLEGKTGAAVLVLDVHDPALLQRVGSFAVPGEISDSRLAGDILYLVTFENSTYVTSFDLSSKTTLRQVDQINFAGSDKRSIIFGNGRMYVGGSEAGAGAIDLIDVSDATGKLAKGAHVTTAGAVFSRWQMSEKDDVLRVVSQEGQRNPAIETFQVWNARSMQAMGKSDLQLPRPEPLKAVRFDGDRAYAITFQQTDPLFIIDLSNPSAPKQRGQLQMNGFMVDLEPRGDRLIGLGVDASDSGGHLNVSLFDVSNMDQPTLTTRVSFGGRALTGNEGAVSSELPEDQDRLQKAFHIGEDGLITVPYSGPASSSCATGGAVQLVKLEQNGLFKGAQLPMAGNPRRALVNQNELVAVSDSNVTAFSLSTQQQTADLVIGTCEVRTATIPPPNQVQPADNVHGYDYVSEGDDNRMFCASSRPGGASTSWASVVALGAVALVFARRRASRRAA